jgi:membrane protease YdiL (CAAX protease family)
VVVGLDQLISRPADAELLAETAAEVSLLPQLLINLLVGLFWGGILEELSLRAGLLTLLARIGWRVLQLAALTQ